MIEKRDQGTMADQRLMWDDLRKNINGLVNRVDESNINDVAEELVSNNLIWGRGLFCRAIFKSLISSPTSAPVFAALVAVVNSKFPDVGYLLLKRILFQAKIAYEHNDKVQLLPFVKLLAHLVNQSVAHEAVALQLQFVLLQEPVPTKESIEIAVSLSQDCGLSYSPRKLNSVFERFQEILDEGDCDDHSKCLIEGVIAMRKSRFSIYPAVQPELDIVEPDDQVTHEISYYHDLDPEMSLDAFHPDSNLIYNYQDYNLIQKILQVGEGDDDNAAYPKDEETTSIEDWTRVDTVKPLEDSILSWQS